MSAALLLKGFILIYFVCAFFCLSLFIIDPRDLLSRDELFKAKCDYSAKIVVFWILGANEVILHLG